MSKVATLTPPLLQLTADNLSKWELTSDQEIGGYSQATLEPSADGIVWSGKTSRDVDPARQRLVPTSLGGRGRTGRPDHRSTPSSPTPYGYST